MKHLSYKSCLMILLISLSSLINHAMAATTELPGPKTSEQQSSKKMPKVINIDEIAKRLQNLLQWEIDHSFIIEQASLNLKNDKLRDKVLNLRPVSEGIIHQLRDLIHQYGREAPEYSRDFKGFFMNGYVASRGMLSDKGVLAALHTNSQLITRPFKQALKVNLPPELKAQLQLMYDLQQKQVDELASLL